MTKIVNGEIDSPYQSFISKSRYSRWLEDENRRETWEETVDRYIGFMRAHVSKTYPQASIPETWWTRSRKAILNLDVMPSMRALMTAGPALERDNLAQYNCSFVAMDDVRAFDEALYVLMNGVGLGFSVESQYVSQLPTISERLFPTNSIIKVADSKRGWAVAFKELIAMLYSGQIPIIDVTSVRPAGARLKTFGGRASGPQPLIDLFDFTIATFKKAAGRKLTPLEAHDIMCKVGDVVVVGGVRRSALISTSDLSDFEMSKAKTGTWYETHGHRRLANNSAVYHKKPSVEQFLHEWGTLVESKSGERGIFNIGDLKSAGFAPRRDMSLIQGVNPCGEILLRSHQLCNLTEVIVKPDDTLESLNEKVAVASFLGTIQSSLTNFKYLRKSWRENCEEERLLGVSLTGQLGHSVLSGSRDGIVPPTAEWLDEMKTTAIDINLKFAKKLGISQSTAITTVKPSGTVSQLTASASGMHPWHSEYYLRNVRCDSKDPLGHFLTEAGVPSEPDVMSPDTTTVFKFPIHAPDAALTRDDLTAIEHLEIWKTYKVHWTEHNPSITVSVREDEWIEVANWVYQNWEIVGGISFLPFDDHVYKQAPYEKCDRATFNQFTQDMPKIDWSLLPLYEAEDNTVGSQTLACSAGNCEVIDLTNAMA